MIHGEPRDSVLRSGTMDRFLMLSQVAFSLEQAFLPLVRAIPQPGLA